MSFRGLRKLAGALALLSAAACGFGAEAATIYTYTYSFTQDYTYILGDSPTTGTLTGGFTGTADSFNATHITLGSLSDFHIDWQSGVQNGSSSDLPGYFSFQIGDASGSTLAFQSPLTFTPSGLIGQACAGAAVSILCAGGTNLGIVSLSGIGPLATSVAGPRVTLVSIAGSGPVATTPIPGALLLFATGLGGLGVLGARRRKFAAAPPPHSAVA